jgi:hypothetical protein
MFGRYWFVACYNNEDENGRRSYEAFRRFSESGLSTLYFQHMYYTDVKCVAVYGSDEEILSVDFPSPDESYAGRERVFELLTMAVLVDAANFESPLLDYVINALEKMPDEQPSLW